MGCQVVLEGYRQRPAKVQGLVLICGSSGKIVSSFHDGPYLEMVLPKLLDLASKSPDMVRAIWSRLPVEMSVKIALKMGEVDPENVRAEDLAPYLEHVTQIDLPMFLRMVQAAGVHDAGDMLGSIEVPVLVVAGERDTFTPARLADAMQKKIPGSELLMVSRGSHVAPLEQPKLVGDAISKFLRERALHRPRSP
jgi:pimeloyl-ACP methyl ester carboxylesterase